MAGFGAFLWRQLDKVVTHKPGIENFRYEVLPQAPTIRLLLKILDNEDDTRISCSLETFLLDKAPPYHAL
jgi:hypothetical protein